MGELRKKYRYLVKVERVIAAPDGAGGFTESFEAVGDFFAAVTSASTTKQLSGGEQIKAYTNAFEFRFDERLVNIDDVRITHAGKLNRCISNTDPTQRYRELAFIAVNN